MTTSLPSVSAVTALIDGVRDLPTPPRVFTQIVSTVDDPNTSAYDVAQLIAEDPAMAAKVLRITNSAYYGLAGTVTSIKHAVVIIGLQGIKSLIVSTSVVDMFKGDRAAGTFQDEFWRHSLVAAFGARMLMRTLRSADLGAGELAFTAGLLHDIGKMIMCLNSPERCQEVVAKASDGSTAEFEVEQELFGCNHAHVGQVLTERWNLPSELSDAIGYHHDPLGLDDGRHLVDIVHVADVLAYQSLDSGQPRREGPRIDPAVFERSGLKLEAAGEYLEGIKEEYLHAETFLNMARGEG